MNQEISAAWFAQPQAPRGDRIAIIGGGLAGCAVAHALAQRGRKVVLFEREQDLANVTSGNPVGIVLPVVPRKPDPMGNYFKVAYRWILAKIKAFEAEGKTVGWQPTGVVHLLAKKRLSRLHEDLIQGLVCNDLAVPIQAEEAARITGFPITQPAIFYPDGGYLQPPSLCKAYGNDPLIEIRDDCTVSALERADGQWLLHTGKTSESADVVVLANGCHASDFPLIGKLPIVPSRGQVALIEGSRLEHRPKSVICHKGYMTPGLKGDVLLGATWREHHLTDLQDEDQQELIEETRSWVPGFSVEGNPALRGRVGFRPRTPDHLPIVGPLTDQGPYCKAFAQVRHGKSRNQLPAPPYLPGLYASLGHGGRGLVATGLAGEIVAAQICGETSPLPGHILDSIHPGRFLIRALRKGLISA